ncbi:ribosomal protein S6 [Podospora australis]|uniref:Small ribosomal subunit protein bS6m n=1 Tax=Podospora australis TaxID=1536484 RepID=A0AAN6WUE1_9PEZI|nr:ribosomal protein S6 [Podospora australis]
MLYETIGIIRHVPNNLPEVKEIVLTVGRTILQEGGVIRDLRNWGVFSLPRTVSKIQQQHTKGHWFIMRYDCSSKTNETIRSALAVDPRVIRHANVKLGNGKLENLSKFGPVIWNRMEGVN